MNTLVKYNDVTLLITNADGDLSLLTSILDDIEKLDTDTKKFYKNLIAADADSIGQSLKIRANKLNYVKEALGIIGTPFDVHDAELYAVNKGIEYEVLELHSNAGHQNAKKILTGI